MSHKPFNDVLKVIWGPGWPLAGTVRNSRPCVFVNAVKEASEIFGPVSQFGYVVCSQTPFIIASTLSFAGFTYTVDMEFADVFELASLPGVQYSAYDIQGVQPRSPLPHYYRLIIMLKPF